MSPFEYLEEKSEKKMRLQIWTENTSNIDCIVERKDVKLRKIIAGVVAFRWSKSIKR